MFRFNPCAPGFHPVRPEQVGLNPALHSRFAEGGRCGTCRCVPPAWKLWLSSSNSLPSAFDGEWILHRLGYYHLPGGRPRNRCKWLSGPVTYTRPLFDLNGSLIGTVEHTRSPAWWLTYEDGKWRVYGGSAGDFSAAAETWTPVEHELANRTTLDDVFVPVGPHAVARTIRVDGEQHFRCGGRNSFLYTYDNGAPQRNHFVTIEPWWP